MAVELNHTIIPATDKWRSAKFLADILGLEAGPEWSHFVPVRTSNGVTLDFAEAAEFRRQHYAFLVSEQEFDTALSHIKHAGIAFYADFNRDGRGQINHLYGGRGCYFDDPDGHTVVQRRVAVQHPVVQRAVEQIERELDVRVGGDLAALDRAGEG